MNTKPFQNISISRLAMGNMRLPQHEDQSIDYVKSQEIIDYAMAHGVTYYDTAYVYNNGESEKFLGCAMKKFPRDSYYLATKYNIGANPDYKEAFQIQLDRLQTDYIDFYLIHCMMDGNIDRYIESGCIEYFLDLQKQGKIRYLGFSSHGSVEALRRFSDHHKWDFAQLQINYFDWLYGRTQDEYKVLEERNIPIMVMEPVRGGRLAQLTPATEAKLKAKHPDWSIASWALRFVQSLPQVQVILSGMSNMEQIIDNVNTFSGEQGLNEEDKALLLAVCEEFSNSVRVPCTKCKYCTPNCPMQIDIPRFLEIYNSYKVDGAGALWRLKKIKEEGIPMPSDCIGCGTCQGHCPQSIEIPEIMKELAEHE